MQPQLLRLTTAGSVDDGKSTLIGRLLHDSNGIFEDQLESVRRASRDGLDLAFVTDGLRAEREQGITIDVAYRYFSTPKRKFIIADTPGHEQYTRNMATGASTADVALILIDARKGLLAQTRRHVCIAWLLGVRRVVFVINKMDAVGYSHQRFDEIRAELRATMAKFSGCEMSFIPVSALKGDNVVHHSDHMPWFGGESLLEYLESATLSSSYAQELRLPVQYVIRSGTDYRGYAGQIASGSLNCDDELLILPSGLRARVQSIDSFEGTVQSAHAPMSVAVRLDGHFDVSRGGMLASINRPPIASRNIRATLIWMSESPLKLQRPYLVKHTTQRVCGQVSRVVSALDIGSIEEAPATELQLNDIGTVELETHLPIFFDPYELNRTTGSFILIDPITNLTVADGMINGSGVRAVSDTDGKPSSGLTLWFTGLSSAGKTTISHAVYERLLAMGHKVELLDGDAVRRHLSKDLGFTEQDRNENIRRIGFVAELLTKNGVIAIVSAISPYRAIRDELRSNIGRFVEVYVNAPLAVCEQRDVKGLYQKARTGLLPQFTGIDDPYEPPLNPEIECRTDRETIAESVHKVIAYFQSRRLPHSETTM